MSVAVRHLAASCRTAARLGARRDGMAALEFALVLPVLVVIYFGLAEVARAVDNSRKLSLFTRTVADLTGRTNNSDLEPVFNASSVILRPFATTSLQIVVNAMGVEQVGSALLGGVCSSYARNGTKRPTLQLNGSGGLPVIPPAYRFDGARYILAEVSMPYTPIVGSSLFRWIFGRDGLVFTRQLAWAERTDSEIVLPGGQPCPVFN